MALPIPFRRRIGAVLALTGVTVFLGSAPVGAEPATPSIPRGMLRIVDDVLGPQNPGFWNPEVPGTRVLTPVEPGVIVACASGFEPTISCSTIDRRESSPQRRLMFFDVPMIGEPPLRVWIDVLPRLGEGSLDA